MADKYTPEEIDEIFGAYNRAIKDGTPITADLARQMKDAAIGVKNYTANLNNSLKGLGNTALKFAENLKDGAQGAAVFNDGLTSTADVISNFLSRFGVLGRILGTVITAGAKYATEANKQSDALYKSYQELTRFGQGTAKGMDDVFSTMQKFSYGIGELDQMTTLLRENSKSLALFGGTVAQGTERIAATANDFKESGLQEYFMKMGVGVDNQNRAIAGYAKQLTNLGQAQNKNQAELTQGAAAYLKEMEGLTRLTGQTREEMEQQREAAMAVDQFALQVSEMGDQGKELQKVFNMLMTVDPTGAKSRAFAESVTGFAVGSKEQNQLFQLSGGKLGGMIDGLTKGTMSAAQFMDQLAPKGSQLEFLKGMAFVPGQLRDFAGGYSDIIKLNSKNWTESAKAGENQTEVTDKVTDAAVSLRQSQMKARDALQSMINDGVLPATQAMAELAGVTEKAAEGSKSYWDKALEYLGLGPKKEEKLSGRGEKFTGTQQEFYEKMYSTLLEEAKKQKIANPEAIARLGASQSALETGYGKSLAGGNNYFGIKARPGEEGSGNQVTQEFINGKMVTIKDKFRKYNNMQESAADYLKFLQENKRYQAVLAAKTAEEAIAAQAKTGYATDPNYGSKLANIHASAQKNTIPGRTAPVSPSSNTVLTMPAGDAAAMARIRESQRSIKVATEELKITSQNQQDQLSATPANSMTNQQTVQTSQSNNNQEMMGAQIDKLDRLIQLMQNQVNISTKILQASR